HPGGGTRPADPVGDVAARGLSLRGHPAGAGDGRGVLHRGGDAGERGTGHGLRRADRVPGLAGIRPARLVSAQSLAGTLTWTSAAPGVPAGRMKLRSVGRPSLYSSLARSRSPT